MERPLPKSNSRGVTQNVTLWHDDKVGYGRPPRHSRWKKGQSGNPRRIYKRAPKSAIALIDAEFAKEITIIENETKRQVTVLEAILLQLWRLEMSGNRYATR